MPVLLDFEKPLEELYEQLDKAQETHEKGKVDMSDTVAQLTKKINNEKKEPLQRPYGMAEGSDFSSSG